MARKKSEFICPKCGNRGYKRTNPVAVVHYDSTSHRKKTCYIKKLLLDQQLNKLDHSSHPLIETTNDSYSLELLDDKFNKAAGGVNDLLNESKYRELTHSEKIEVFNKFKDKEKLFHEIISRQKKMMVGVCDEMGVTIPKSPLVSMEFPPERFWGESEVFYKLGDLAKHFHRIGRHLEKIQKLVYKFRPNEDISTLCVKDLDIFMHYFLNPVEKLLIPYSDLRWCNDWIGWFKIQMDSFLHGPRAAGEINAILTGKSVMRLGKDKKSVEIIPVKREFTSLQVKKKQQQILEFANLLVSSHPLQKALNGLANVVITEEIKSPEQFYKEQMKKEGNGNIGRSHSKKKYK